jgi:hypothetical protein
MERTSPTTLEEWLKAHEDRLQALERSLGQLTNALSAGFPLLLFPEPLAGPLARELSASFFHEKFFSLLDAGEACIKYTAAVVIGLTSSATGPALDVSPLFGRPIPLGAWASIIQSSFDVLVRVNTRIAAEVQKSIFRTDGKPTAAARFIASELVNLRNRERGHGASRPEGVYEELYRRFSSSVHDSIHTLSFLRLPLVRVERVNALDQGFLYDLRTLMGPSPIGRIERIVSTVRSQVGDVCIWDGAESLVSLRGLVVYRACPECGLEHTYFLDRATDSGTTYHTYSGSHRLQDPPHAWATRFVRRKDVPPTDGS